jgi:hypothetical protein
VDLVGSDVSEEYIASIIRVIRISELGTLEVSANVVSSSPIPVTLRMEAIISSETSVLKQPYSITSQKTAFFIVNTVETSNLT